MKYKTAKTLFDEIKVSDNKELYAICQYIVSTVTDLEKDIAKTKDESNVITTDIDFDDKDAVRTRTLQQLYQLMLDGNATAGNYFAKYVGLEEDTSSLTIEIVRFKDIKDSYDLDAVEDDQKTIDSCEEITGQVRN